MIFRALEQPQKDIRTKIGRLNVRIVKIDHPDWGMTCGTPNVENITRALGVVVSANSNLPTVLYIYGAWSIVFESYRGGVPLVGYSLSGLGNNLRGH